MIEFRVVVDDRVGRMVTGFAYYEGAMLVGSAWLQMRVDGGEWVDVPMVLERAEGGGRGES